MRSLAGVGGKLTSAPRQPRPSAASHRRSGTAFDIRCRAGQSGARYRRLPSGRRAVHHRPIAIVAALATASALLAVPAFAQKQGGTLRMYLWDNPPSASIHEESTVSTVMPFMALFNNLVLYDQAKKLNTMDGIVPELATSWGWNEEKTRLTFELRKDVKWHDGRPFTAKDVVCTMEKLQGKAEDKFRKNPRKIWWHNLKEVVADGDFQVSFILERPQPSFLALFATGYTPIYPCHVSAQDMRTKPVGTGPFKFVEFKGNETVKLIRNADYWRRGHPYVDAIDWRIIANRSTRVLAFIAGEFDMTFSLDLTVPLVKDIKSQLPNAICELQPTNNTTNLIVNRNTSPFSDAKIRRALALALDRKAFIDILTEGHARIGAVMLLGPEGSWGMPSEMVAALPGYGTYIEKNQWFDKVARGDYSVGLNLTAAALDDPDVNFYENYACGSERNYTNYCDPAVDKLIERQSQETDLAKRRTLIWEVETKLAEDVARPIIMQGVAGLCWQPYVKGFVLHHNGIYNNWRFDDVWLEK